MTAPESRRVCVRVHGLVQGVGFRATTLSEARRLGLAGWVRNRHDGTLEVFAQGPEPKLRLLLAFLHEGPPAARVTSLQAIWDEGSGAPMPFQAYPTQ